MISLAEVSMLGLAGRLSVYNGVFIFCCQINAVIHLLLSLRYRAELERYMTCAKEAAQQVLQDDELKNDPELMQKVHIQFVYTSYIAAFRITYRLDGLLLVPLVCTKLSSKRLSDITVASIDQPWPLFT